MKHENMNTLTNTSENNRQIAIWLMVIAALIFTMVVLGGVTRLTRSGLSMVDWKPVVGIIPPLNEREWKAEFDKYKKFPEYQKINKDRGMDLEGFKSIFYFEYGHRVLGRLIGLAFLIPLLIFLWQKKVSRELAPKLVTIFILGGLQGLLGWFMVKSGLVDKPHVSQYRLTAHLSAAIIIYSYIVWVVLDLLYPRAQPHIEQTRQLAKYGYWATGLVALMIISGGFVAGTKAGFLFNHQWTVPFATLFFETPWWLNFVENVATIQFTHRTLAVVVFAVLAMFWWKGIQLRQEARTVKAFHIMAGILILQLTLGITTLVFVVPVWLGASHQAGALVLFTAMIYLNHALARRG